MMVKKRKREENHSDDNDDDNKELESQNISKSSSFSKTKLTDLDAQIAALEAEMQNESSSDESVDSDSEFESDKSSSRNQNNHTDISNDKNGDLEDDDAEELERIPKLPAHLLPSRGISQRIQNIPSIAKTETKTITRLTCDVCRGIVCANKFELQKHKRTLLHRQNTVLAAGAAYEPARKRALYCRYCALEFTNEDEFFEHRETEKHKEMASAERRRSHCKVCDKQFTSSNQLTEHVSGKAHKLMLEQKQRQWSRRR